MSKTRYKVELGIDTDKNQKNCSKNKMKVQEKRNNVKPVV